MQIMVTFISEQNQIDLLIDNRQKIKDTLSTVEAAGMLSDPEWESIYYVKSLRMNRRFSIFCSYKEAGIYSGDILEVCNHDT